MAFPETLSQDQIDKYFPVKSDPPEGIFELGLVLGGTVSAGAYTGGVLDYLIEALDAWHRAREKKDPEAPPHRVVLTTVGGTSGGAINGAILLRAAGREFDHGPSPDNPFFDAWTGGVDLMKLLATDDGKLGFDSLLNTGAIERQVASTIKWEGGRELGERTSPKQRGYLGDPLRLFMMVGNVTGVPYRVPMISESGFAHDLVAHADYLRFALPVPGGVVQEPTTRPDELKLGSGADAHWRIVGEAALATSAFPLAFRGRDLERALEATGYRAFAIPGDDGSAIVQQLVPVWESLPLKKGDPTFAAFANVDGGTFNNEPLDVVRQAMNGMNGRNPRNPKEARRAVILVDPFSDPETLSNPDSSRLTAMIGPLVSAMIQQPRFKPADLALACSEEVYSRFLVAPTRYGPNGKIVGKKAIASGGLGGFLGFLDSKLLVHDYMLGRANAHSFVKRHLMLPEAAGNPLFDDPWWTEARKEKFGTRDSAGERYLPIIPLMDDLRDQSPELQAWPAPTPLPAGFEKAVEARLDAIYAKLTAQLAPKSWWQKAAMNAYLWIGWKAYGRSALRDIAVNAFKKGLKEQELA